MNRIYFTKCKIYHYKYVYEIIIPTNYRASIRAWFQGASKKLKCIMIKNHNKIGGGYF